jgi:hypothetical protein
MLIQSLHTICGWKKTKHIFFLIDYLKHALQVQHEHCYFHELKQVAILTIY